MATALITGILGQDGSLLAELLLARGYRVVGTVRPGSPPPDAARRALTERCELVEIDLARPRDEDWAASLVTRVQPDEVYHLAACHRSSDPGLRDDPAQQQHMVDVNYAAALALAHALLRHGRGSLVVAGSSQMYTSAIPPPRIDERSPHAPATFYGVTKSSCLTAVRWLRERQGLRGSCAILFNHESPRRPLAFASRKITHGAARIAAGLDTTLELADLSSQVDFSSALDVVEGLHAMAIAEQPDERVIASGELHRLEDLCRVAFTAVGLDWHDHVRSIQPPGERPAVVGDPGSIESELGWSRRRSFTTWIQEMVEADRRTIVEG